MDLSKYEQLLSELTERLASGRAQYYNMLSSSYFQLWHSKAKTEDIVADLDRLAEVRGLLKAGAKHRGQFREQLEDCIKKDRWPDETQISKLIRQAEQKAKLAETMMGEIVSPELRSWVKPCLVVNNVQSAAEVYQEVFRFEDYRTLNKAGSEVREGVVSYYGVPFLLWQSDHVRDMHTPSQHEHRSVFECYARDIQDLYDRATRRPDLKVYSNPSVAVTPEPALAGAKYHTCVVGDLDGHIWHFSELIGLQRPTNG